MQAASAAFPACAFHAMTGFGLECGLALAGATITAAVASETVKRRERARRPSSLGGRGRGLSGMKRI